MGTPSSHPFQQDFPYQKRSICGVAPIYGTPHMLMVCNALCVYAKLDLVLVALLFFVLLLQQLVYQCVCLEIWICMSVFTDVSKEYSNM